MKVKFCGISRSEEAALAASLGADYIGFLVGITHTAEDKLTNRQAREILDSVDLRGSVPVAVTHLTAAGDVISTMKELGIYAVQLHDVISPEEILKIRDAIPDAYIIKSVHVVGERSVEDALELEEYADALVLDTITADRIGGTGLTHDWSISKKIVSSVKKPVFLAGGLNTQNLARAIETVRPYGVDVNSGVEFPDGRKNPDKMRQFIKIARGELV